MKGPHFFEKRKKEMARQEKAKQKAERKAQRKAKGKDGEPGDDDDDLLLGEAGEIDVDGSLPGSEEASAQLSQKTSDEAPHEASHAVPDHSSTPIRPRDPG